MERIRLTKTEKLALRWIALGRKGLPPKVTSDDFFVAVVTLTEKHLVLSKTNYEEIVDARLTAKGRVYLSQNPHLLNPTNWTKVAAIAAWATAIAGFLALFISCSLLKIL